MVRTESPGDNGSHGRGGDYSGFLEPAGTIDNFDQPFWVSFAACALCGWQDCAPSPAATKTTAQPLPLRPRMCGLGMSPICPSVASPAWLVVMVLMTPASAVVLADLPVPAPVVRYRAFYLPWQLSRSILATVCTSDAACSGDLRGDRYCLR